ncbi:MAG: type VII secretion protein EccB [Sporichthyaceae bacterium]
MASKKDLIEAHAYNRRRLVTAFVSGAPGGREVEPGRPGRAIVAGIVLAALVAGAGAMAGVIKPTVKDGWDNNSIVVARNTGARYLAQNGSLFPVINAASARLLIPPDEFKVVFAPEDRIARAPQGATIGIPQAPDAIPEPGNLVQSGWASCMRSGTDNQTSVHLTQVVTTTAATGQALIVTAAQRTFLVTGRMAYPIPTDEVDSVASALGLGSARYPVPMGWINLFTPGTSIGPLIIPGAKALAPGAGLDPQLTVGQLIRVAKVPHVVVKDGVVPLSPVQERMLLLGSAKGKPVPGFDSAPQLGTAPAALAQAASWPQQRPVPYLVEGRAAVACVVLEASPRAAAITTLAAPIANVYLGPQPGGVVRVDPGAGALVSTGPGEALYLVDGQGISYALASTIEAAQLGFGAVRPTFVPSAWIKALRPGPLLDRNDLAPDAETAVARTGARPATRAPAS